MSTSSSTVAPNITKHAGDLETYSERLSVFRSGETVTIVTASERINLTGKQAAQLGDAFREHGEDFAMTVMQLGLLALLDTLGAPDA